MPFPVLPLPSSFSLPQIEGAPSVSGRVVPPQVSAIISTSLASVYETWLIREEKKQWGFYGKTLDSNKGDASPVLTASSVYSIELEEAYAVSSAPQEDGAFTSYNKVKIPTFGAVRLICDGFQTGASLVVEAVGQSRALWDDAARPSSIRKSFLQQLESIVADTKLYELHTPEKIWPRVNIIGYRVTRSPEQPQTILFVDVRFVEVRSANVATKAAPKNPQGAATVDNGISTVTGLPIIDDLINEIATV